MPEEAQPAPKPFRGAFDKAFLTDAADATEVHLIRHGEQELPTSGRIPVGVTIDPPLSARGRRQAELVGMRYSTAKIDAVYASPLQRALDTGKQVARHHRLEPVIMHELREVEIFRDVPPEKSAVEVFGEPLLLGMRERMLRERRWDVYPLSESSLDFRRRAVNAVEGIIATNQGKRVVIACHGGIINAYVAHIIGSPYDMFFRPAHTSVHIVAAGDGIRALHRLNDIQHLETAEGSFVSH
ncbi:MAG: histidine phosphatase family protein [Dehalococcoidia bacterium]